MENIILQSMLNEFSKKHQIVGKESLIFEKFVSYCLFSHQYYDSYDEEQVGTGECVGVDAVAIAVNDVLVYSVAATKNHTQGQFDVSFNFMQAKTSASLNLGDYLKFLQTVLIFFTRSENEQPEELREAFRIKEQIYEKASRFRTYPTLELNYVYTGKGVIEDPTFSTQIRSVENSIKGLPYLFSQVSSNLLGANAIADKYKATLNRTTRHLFFQRHVPLPKLASATAAYLGVASCRDYIEFLKGEDGQINKGAFYDNVRDYLGDKNKVNSDIEDTIKSDSQRNLFSVLNNGVTIVARKVIPSGDRFEISGFQVVNGCQTSHVLFNNKEHVTDDMFVTIKLIETDDIDLSSNVIKATNSQSLVMKEAFATIKPYHKRLEDFFKAMNANGHRFFYERRPHQFDDRDDILNSEIVSAPLLIKSFVSVVIGEPHKVHFYYGQILRDYNSDKDTLVFDDKHHPGFYFLSHLVYAKSREIAIKNKIGAWSYHFAFLMKKRLGIRLTINDTITDSQIIELVNNIQRDFASAATDVLSVFKDVRLTKDDVMLPEKTKELNHSFSLKFNASPKKSAAKSDNRLSAPIDKPTEVLRKFFADGIYVVKKLVPFENGLRFDYGSQTYFAPFKEKISYNNELTLGKISISQGHITEVQP